MIVFALSIAKDYVPLSLLKSLHEFNITMI